MLSELFRRTRCRGRRAARGLMLAAAAALAASAFIPGSVSVDAKGGFQVGTALLVASSTGNFPVPNPPVVPVGTGVIDTSEINSAFGPGAAAVTFSIYNGTQTATGPDVCVTANNVTTTPPVPGAFGVASQSGLIATGLTTGLSPLTLGPGDYEFQSTWKLPLFAAITSPCGSEHLTVAAPNSMAGKAERDLGPNAAAGDDPDSPAYVTSITTALTGDVLQYQVSYVNTGTWPASNIVLADTIPAGTSYVGGSCMVVGGSGFTCNDSVPGMITVSHLGPIPQSPANTSPAPEGSFKVKITAAAPFTITDQYAFTNDIPQLPPHLKTPLMTFRRMAVAPAAALQPPKQTGNSNSVVATGPKSSLGKNLRDLGASSGVAPGADPATPAYVNSINVVQTGDVLQYQLTYSNGGSAAAAGVKVTDTIPAGASYYNPGAVSSCLPAAGWSCDDHSVAGTVILTNPSVPAGATSVVAGTVKVRVTATGTFTIHNVGQVTTTAEMTPISASADASGHPAPTPPPTPTSTPSVATGPTAAVAGTEVVSTPTTGAGLPVGLAMSLVLFGSALLSLAGRRRRRVRRGR